MTGAITREQLVAMLFRYAVKNGLEAVTLSENLTQFTDASNILSLIHISGAKNRPMKRAGSLADLSCRSDGLTRIFLFTKWKIGYLPEPEQLQ